MQIKKLEDQAGKPLFLRRGRGLVPTEAGEKLLIFARKIIALNDEAAITLGVGTAECCVKLGLPQDFFEVVLPETIKVFSSKVESAHVDVRAGRNFALEEDVRAGRLDAAIAFFPDGSEGHGELIARLPTYWFSHETAECLATEKNIPLVLFDHPCLFRTTALSAMDGGSYLWRAALTTPSLEGVWAAVQAQLGVTLRTLYCVPKGICPLPEKFGLPESKPIELRLLVAKDLSPAAKILCEALRQVTLEEMLPFHLQP